MKNSADQGGCYSQKPKAEVDNTLQNLQNSSYPTKAEYFHFLKGISPFCSLFFSRQITQPFPQVFSVNGSINAAGCTFDVILTSFVQ